MLALAVPAMHMDQQTVLLRAQLCLGLPEHLRAMVQFNSAMSWDNLIVCLDKSLPHVTAYNAQQQQLHATQQPSRWDTQAQEACSLIKQEPLEANWTDTRSSTTNNTTAFRNTNQRGNTNRNNESTRFNGSCNYCKKFGHKEVDCRAKKRDQPQQQQRNFNTNNSNNRFTNRPNRSNTNSNRYPPTSQSNTNTLSAESSYVENNSQDSNNSEFPYFTADVISVDSSSQASTPLLKSKVELVLFNQNPQTVLALIDGGSSHSFISPTVLTEAQLRIAGTKNSTLFRRQNFQINGATGSSKSSCCITTANIQLGNWSGKHEFIISGSVKRHDMIIGRDFFKAHAVKVDHSDDTMTVDGMQIQLNSLSGMLSKSFQEEEDDFLDTNEPKVSVHEQLKNIQEQLSELKSHQAPFQQAKNTLIQEHEVKPTIELTSIQTEQTNLS